MPKRTTMRATSPSKSHDFISDLPNSPATPWWKLFLRIIVELFRRHWSSTGQDLPTWTDVVAVERAHLRILQAIGDGDESLARYRVRRHLDAAASWWH